MTVCQSNFSSKVKYIQLSKFCDSLWCLKLLFESSLISRYSSSGKVYTASTCLRSCDWEQQTMIPSLAFDLNWVQRVVSLHNVKSVACHANASIPSCKKALITFLAQPADPSLPNFVNEEGQGSNSYCTNLTKCSVHALRLQQLKPVQQHPTNTCSRITCS